MILLYMLYSAIFPRFFSLAANPKAEPTWAPVVPTILGKFPRLDRIRARIYLNWYMPIFRPVSWWRHMNAVNELLEAIGWIDVDI